MHRHAPLSLAAGLVLLLGSSASCRSAPPESKPYAPAPDEEPPVSIGVYVTKLDALVAQWNDAMTRPPTQRNLNLRLGLERELAKQVKQRFEELRATLESSRVTPARAILAAALGFAKEAGALNPILNALSDPAQDVRENALLGLGILADPNTPIDRVALHLSEERSEGEQSNAAFALKRLGQAGARMDGALPALRAGLRYPSGAVRLQCAAALGVVRDAPSGPELVVLLRDERSLVAAAAANALGQIGDPSAIPALIQGLAAKDLAVREESRSALTRMNSGEDLGADSGPWRRWWQQLSLSRPAEITSVPEK